MKCKERKLLSEVDTYITLTCDLEKGHFGMHKDNIHNVFWTNEAGVYAKQNVERKIYVYEGKPAPAIYEEVAA